MILYIETILNMTFSCLTVRGGGLSKLTFWENGDCPADSEISYFQTNPCVMRTSQIGQTWSKQKV